MDPFSTYTIHKYKLFECVCVFDLSRAGVPHWPCVRPLPLLDIPISVGTTTNTICYGSSSAQLKRRRACFFSSAEVRYLNNKYLPDCNWFDCELNSSKKGGERRVRLVRIRSISKPLCCFQMWLTWREKRHRKHKWGLWRGAFASFLIGSLKGDHTFPYPKVL